MAPRRTGSPGTAVGRTAGRARQSRGTSAATRAASSRAAGLADRAAEHDEAGVEDDADRGDADGDPVREVVEERGPRRCPCASRRAGDRRSVGHRGGRRRLGRRGAAEAVLGGQGLHREAAGQRLQPGLARVLVPGRERRAVHRHPADLARRAADAPAHLAVDDRGEAEAGAEPDEREVVEPGRGPVGALGHRGQVHVVLDHHRGVQHLAQRRRARPRARSAGSPPAAARRSAGRARRGCRSRPRTARRSRSRRSAQARPMASRTMPTGSSAPLRVHADVGHPAPGHIRDSGADQVRLHI